MSWLQLVVLLAWLASWWFYFVSLSRLLTRTVVAADADGALGANAGAAAVAVAVAASSLGRLESSCKYIVVRSLCVHQDQLIREIFITPIALQHNEELRRPPSRVVEGEVVLVVALEVVEVDK